jgi:hypothetical protein
VRRSLNSRKRRFPARAEELVVYDGAQTLAQTIALFGRALDVGRAVILPHPVLVYMEHPYRDIN